MRAFGRWLYIVPLMLFASVALGANYTYETVRTSPGAYTTTGVKTPTTVKFTPPSASPRFYQMVPTATKSVVGATARAALRGGPAGWAAAAAVGAIVEGAGYVIDSATGEIQKPVETVVPPPGAISAPAGSRAGCSNAVLGTPTYANCLSACNAMQYCFTWHTDVDRVSMDGWTCPASHPVGYEVMELRLLCYPTEGEVITDYIDLDPSDWEVLEDEWWDGLSPRDKSSLMQWAITDASPRGTVDTDNYPVVVTSPNPSVQTLYDNYPEFQTMLQELLNAEIARWLALQDPTVELTEEEQRIVDTGSITEPIPTETGESVTDLPAFCEWASFICEPFVSTPHPDVPTVDLEVEDYDSGLPGTAMCPAPVEINTGFGQWEISLEPSCQFAEAIRLPLLAISYLIAGFIVVGVRR